MEEIEDKRMTFEDKAISVRPIHYLGSKLRILPAIKNALDEVDPDKGKVVDLFSGSGTVSNYLLQYRDVVSVDIQHYSQVLCEASMGVLTEKNNIDLFLTETQNSYFAEKMLSAFQPLIEYERQCFEKAKWGDIADLYKIIESGSLYICANDKALFSAQRSELESVLTNLILLLNTTNDLQISDYLICWYYGGLYFSYEQAIWMDILEYHIMKHTGLLKTKLLAALLSTASDVVNTVGKQFAQPLKVRDSRGNWKKNLYSKIEKDREIDVLDTFKKWAIYYLNIEREEHSYRVICDDYVSALASLKKDNISAVYADPPYTRYHYSRYYHVLETICLKDTPKISTTFPNGKGGTSRAIYREDRYQSPFCIKSQAERAFDQLFMGVKEIGVPLVLSYSPFDVSKAVTPRLQTMDQLIERAKIYYSKVQLVSPGEFTHSKLNSAKKNLEVNHEAELLILCE